MTLEDFLAHEARYSVGNYVVVDTTGSRFQIITSIGYCGGYVYLGKNSSTVATHITPVLSQVDEIEMDPFGLSFFLNYAPQSNFNMLPFTTMFKNVRRVPPATHLELENGKLKTFRSYLGLTRLNPPKTFKAAMEETAATIGKYCKRNDKKAGVMFSGGVDCLVIYLSLREAMGENNVKLFTMEHSASNGPERSLPVAKSLGVEVTVVQDKDIYKTNKMLKNTVEMIKQDQVVLNAPHTAFVTMDVEDMMIFSGQNFDSIANIHMSVLQETQEVGYLSKAARRIAHTENREKRQNNAFLNNLQLTDDFLGDSKFQALTVDYFASCQKNASPDPDPGFRGTLRGMISRQYPNLLSPAKYPLDQVKHLNKEVDIFEKYIKDGEKTTRMAVDMIRHVTYAHFASKRISSFPISPSGMKTELPAMTGPSN